MYAQMLIKDKTVRFRVDCEATVDLLPVKFITDEEITPTNHLLQMCNKTELKQLGVTLLTIRNPFTCQEPKSDSTTSCCSIELHYQQDAPDASATHLIEEFNDEDVGVVDQRNSTLKLRNGANVQLVVSAPSRRSLSQNQSVIFRRPKKYNQPMHRSNQTAPPPRNPKTRAPQ